MAIKFQSIDVKEERTSIPTPRQFRVGHNPNYLNSLMCGVFSPILHLPQIIWFNSVWPFLKSLVAGLVFIVMSIVAGVLGRANGFVVTEMAEREPTREEKERALNEMLAGSGYRAVPIETPAQDFHASGQH